MYGNIRPNVKYEVNAKVYEKQASEIKVALVAPVRLGDYRSDS